MILKANFPHCDKKLPFAPAKLIRMTRVSDRADSQPFNKSYLMSAIFVLYPNLKIRVFKKDILEYIK